MERGDPSVRERAEVSALNARDFYDLAVDQLGVVEVARITGSNPKTVEKTWGKTRGGRIPWPKRRLLERELVSRSGQPAPRKERNSQDDGARPRRKGRVMVSDQNVIWTQVMSIIKDRAKHGEHLVILKKLLDDWVPVKKPPPRDAD